MDFTKKPQAESTAIILAHMRAELDEVNITAMLAHPKFEETKKLVAERTGYDIQTIDIRFRHLRDLLNGKLSSAKKAESTGRYLAGAISGGHLTDKQTLTALNTLTKSVADLAAALAASEEVADATA